MKADPIICTDKEAAKAQELLAAFLEGMEEDLTVMPELQNTIESCRNGSATAYIRESFGNYLLQCTDSPKAVGSNGFGREEPRLKEIETEEFVESDGEIRVAVYRKSDMTLTEAIEDGALYKVPSTVTYANQTALCDLIEVVETIGKCIGWDADSIGLARIYDDGRVAPIEWDTIDRI